MNRRSKKHLVSWMLLYAILLVALLPHFVNILRMVQFNIIPRDHYYNILLRMLRVTQSGSFFGEAPFGYRVLNILIAAPFYLIPPFVFRRLPGHTAYTAEQLRASQAIVLANYVCLIAIVVLSAYVVHRLYKRNGSKALLSGLLAFVCLFFSGWYSLDIPVLLYVFVVLCVLHKPYIATPLLAISGVFNEKIFIIFALLFSIRLITPSLNKKQSAYYLCACVVALASYYALTRIANLPLPEHQSQISHYPSTFLHNITTSFSSLRGLIVNVVPIALLATLAYFHTRSLRHVGGGGTWLPARYRFNYQQYDYLLIVGYLIVCMVASTQFNLGRLMITLFPFYLFGATEQLYSIFERKKYF